MIHQNKGFMIRQTNYSESSKIITLLSEHGALVPLMARGFNKPRSPFNSLKHGYKHTLFTYSRHRGMGTLTEVDIIDSYNNINSDFDTYTIASYIVELITRVTDEEIADPSLYRLMHQAFKLLDEKNEKYSVLSFVIIKLFPMYGALLNVDKCVLCGSYSYENMNRYSFKYHGVICNDHYDEEHLERSVYVSSRSIYLAAFLKHVQVEHLNSINIGEEDGKKLFKFVDMLFQEYTGEFFKTRKLLQI